MTTVRSFLFLISAVVLSFGAVAQSVSPPDNGGIRYYIEVPEGGLTDLLSWHPNRVPMVSPHRGGPMPGFPENAIETFDNALRYGPAMLETDVRQLSDGTLILMHDRRLDRTTTGSGLVVETTWPVAARLFLKDNDGAETPYRIPRLDEALSWVIGKAILNLDIKRGVNVDKLIASIRSAGAEDHVALISYTIEQAQALHAKAPDLMINVGMRTQDDIETVKASGIDPQRVIAWTGLRALPPMVYQAIHKEGWRVAMGTLGFNDQAIDRVYKTAGTDERYLDHYAAGVDIISTDRFWAVQNQLWNPTILFFEAGRSNLRRSQ